MLTQCQMVLDHLKTHGMLTSAEAMRLYGIARLASRISDLREAGYTIKSVPVVAKNRYGRTVRYTAYTWGET